MIMNWLRRFKTRQPKDRQTITLQLSRSEWDTVERWAKSSGWSVNFMITKWVRNRLHGTGTIGN